MCMCMYKYMYLKYIFEIQNTIFYFNTFETNQMHLSTLNTFNLSISVFSKYIKYFLLY